eukprot:400774-Amphidinium_carterae.1
MTRQACRRLKKRKQKKSRTGFGTTEARISDLELASSQGGALGSAAAAVSGHRHPQGRRLENRRPLLWRLLGEPAGPRTGSSGEPTPRRIWPIFRLSQRAPD